MSTADRTRWDARYLAQAPHAPATPGLPHVLSALARFLPATGRALEIACGRGEAAVWLAEQGLDVRAVDVSRAAIDQACALRAHSAARARLRLEVFDLDHGLPAGPPVDVLLCCRFRCVPLYPAMLGRLAPGGILAVATRSEVGAGPGHFRSRPGELCEAFAELQPLAAEERDGMASFIGRRTGARERGSQERSRRK